MVSARDILWLCGFPAIIAVLAMAVAQPWRRGRDLPGWAAAGAIAGGFVVAFIGMLRVPPFPPNAGEQWLFFLAAPLVLVAVAQGLIRSAWFGIAISAALLLVTPYLILRNQHAYLGGRVVWSWSIGVGIGMIAWWAAMELLARRVRGSSLPLLMALFAGVGGLAIIDAHSQVQGMLAGSIAVPLSIIALAAGWARGAALPRGGVLAVALLVPALLLCGYFFADLTLRDFLLITFAPLAAWAGEVPWLGKSDSWRRVAVRWAAVAAVIALPAFRAVSGLRETMNEQTESYQYESAGLQ